jgi:hypothetical protein
MWNKIINPFFVYCITWLLVIYLISLKLTTNISILNLKGLIIILFNVVSSLFLYIFLLPLKKRINKRNDLIPSNLHLEVA